MEEIEKFLKSEIDANEVYSSFAKVKFSSHLEAKLPAIFNCFQRELLRKDLVYLSLLVNEDRQVFKSFLKFELAAGLKLTDSTSIYLFVKEKGRHWFEALLQNEVSSDVFDDNFRNSLNFTRLVKATNVDEVEVGEVEELLCEVGEVEDEFLKLYVCEVKTILENVRFCRNENVEESEVFTELVRSSLLETYSKYLDLSDSEVWNEVLDRLRSEEIGNSLYLCNVEAETPYTPVENFQAFTVLFTVAKCLQTSDKTVITGRIKDATEAFASLKNFDLQLEIVETVFKFCAHESEKTLCELRLLLDIVKVCLDEIRFKQTKKDSQKFNVLYKDISEFLWRFEVLCQVKKIGEDENVMKFMLAEPESLIKICLKANNFDMAKHVIKMFELEETPLVAKITFTENLNNLRQDLIKTHKLLTLQQTNPHLTTSNLTTPTKLLTNFFQPKTPNYFDLFDIALTLPSSSTHSSNLITFAEEHFDSKNLTEEYLKFHDRILELYGEVEGVSLCEVVCDPNYHFVAAERVRLRELYKNLRVLVGEFCGSFEDKGIKDSKLSHQKFHSLEQSMRCEGNYLEKLFVYLKVFHQVLLVDGNHMDLIAKGGNASLFEILRFSRREILRKLIFQRSLAPHDFEGLFKNLKLDLLHHVASSCFPEVTLKQTEVYEAETTSEVPVKHVFKFIQKRNWLLAFIISELHNLNEFQDINEDRTKYFTNLINLKQTQNLKILYKNSRILTVLNKNYIERFIDYLQKHVFYDASDCPHGELSFETAEEILEDDFKCSWKFLLEILESIPEFMKNSWSDFEAVRDRILSNLVVDTFEVEHYQYVRFIEDNDLRLELILKNFQMWSADFCVPLLREELLRLEGEEKLNVEAWLKKIEYCEEIRIFFIEIVCWYEVYQLCTTTPEIVVQKLLMVPKVDLLLGFFDLFENNSDLLEEHLDFDYLYSVFVFLEPLSAIEKLLKLLPQNIAEDFIHALLKNLKNLEHLQFLIDFLKDSPTFPKGLLKRIKISTSIISNFSINERDQYWPLLCEPKDIVETLLMNMKFDKLTQAIKVLNEQLGCCEYDEDISIEAVDTLLRKYAEKSLEFRVILNPHPKLIKSDEIKLMESLDSFYGPDKKMYVMPAATPDKADWVPNNEVIECMCCRNVEFSMFNRRHHCRRCGRVVCFNCSNKRLKVDKYGDILVRVCIDCYEQSRVQDASTSDNVSCKSIVYDYWVLTGDPQHDEIVRQEFAYEYAPSVSLCLTIMKHHSKSGPYPEFLLMQCEIMLKLLQPLGPNSPHEIDYPLLVKMISSMAIAAKILSVECQLKWGISHADKILTQVDLLGLLIDHGCLELLPVQTYNGAPYVNWNVLVNLRDKLLDYEHWHFVLVMSTKAGLDHGVVFAEWGKSCLRAGCLKLAREKFQRCLDKNAPSDSSEHSTSAEIDEGNDRPRRRRRQLSKVSKGSNPDSKLTTNEQLVNQIVNILESQTTQLETKKKRADPRTALLGQQELAICLKAKLRNLGEISMGNYEIRDKKKQEQYQQVFLDECVYYLTTYGTHLCLLQFYLRHKKLEKALNHILEKKVSNEIFVEIYISCLKEGVINNLQEEMAKIDSTLDVWKEHLRYLCRYLERGSLMNSLYQLQLFMGDYVRASMTCIKFYRDRVTSYTELLSNIHFLYDAEEHLKQELEQQQWVEVNSVINVSSESKVSFEEKALSNPSLVMKLDARSVEMQIKRIKIQIEITRFLAAEEPEKPDKYMQKVLDGILPTVCDDCVGGAEPLPTLFDSQHAKSQLAILVILYGKTVEDGFPLAYQIIQYFKLKPIKVYCQSGRQLALEGRHSDIADLVTCIRDVNDDTPAVTDMCDEMLALAAKTMNLNNAPPTQLDAIIKLMTDRAIKISIYIETRQLKSAFILAARYNRFGDVRRILREAEALNKPDVKKLCQKLLQAHSHSHKD